jgi:hypothetical protein
MGWGTSCVSRGRRRRGRKQNPGTGAQKSSSAINSDNSHLICKRTNSPKWRHERAAPHPPRARSRRSLASPRCEQCLHPNREPPATVLDYSRRIIAAAVVAGAALWPSRGPHDACRTRPDRPITTDNSDNSKNRACDDRETRPLPPSAGPGAGLRRRAGTGGRAGRWRCRAAGASSRRHRLGRSCAGA